MPKRKHKNLLTGAPQFITSRFGAVNQYVWATLCPESFRSEHFKKIKYKKDRLKEYSRLRAISSEASLLVFIFLLRKFFIEGSEAAKNAVDTFKELDVNGFYIGSTFFQDRNQNVMRGELLATHLMDSINEEAIRNKILTARYVSEILEDYRKQL